MTRRSQWAGDSPIRLSDSSRFERWPVDLAWRTMPCRMPTSQSDIEAPVPFRCIPKLMVTERGNRNIKNQAPNTKEIPGSKLQTAARASSLELGASLAFGAWCLDLFWSLVFGVWSFNWPKDLSS